ncbi:MAG: MFS transporter [Chloroflexi bacterium]|nr:MFS transporter [Chloroflexota bacterium]
MQQRSGFRVLSPTSIFYGWWIVLAAFMVAFIYSGFFFYDFTLFVTPIREDIPDVGAAIEPAFIVATVLGAVVSPLLGGFFDKSGPKPVVGGGMLLGAAGFAIMGVMTEPWHLYIGLTLAGLGPIVFFAGGVSAVVNWFDRMRGRAVGITVVGLGAGGILTRPSLYVMEAIGWRDSFLLMAAIIIIVLLPMAFVLRRSPEDYGMRPDGDEVEGADASGALQGPILYGLPFTQILRTPTFWFLSLLMFLSFWPIGALQIHQAPFMEDAGYSRLAAADAVGAMALITIVGRIGGGWLADKMDPRRGTVIATLLQAIGIAAFALSRPEANWYLILFFVAFSPGFGAIIVLQPALLATYFGRRAFGAAQGFLWTMVAMAVSVSPYVATLSDEYLGGMQNGFLMFAAFSLLAMILVFVVLPRPGIVRPRGRVIIPPEPESSGTRR